MRRKATAKRDASAHEQAEPGLLTRRGFLLAGAGTGAGLFVLGLGGGWPVGAEAAPLDLDIFTQGYPRTFFFRQTEADAASGRLSYEEFEKRYLPLGGIVGKVLNEEHDFTDKNNLLYFLRYKERNPSKMVLLHYNGTGRRATDEATTRFFAGHFLYYKGTELTQPLEASFSASLLHVADTSVFSLGRYKVENVGIKDDVVIAPAGDDGKPKWEEAEHLRLQAIDVENNTIAVDRGAYGTQPLSFPAGSFLAAHVMTGPFRSARGVLEDDLPLWSYNLSTVCPRDAQGRNCGDALVDYLVGRLGDGGDLSSCDGITIDVFRFTLVGFPPKDVDVNSDGKGDGGIVRGVDTFSFGSLELLENLRGRLPDKIILSDGQTPNKLQRGFGYLNGVESEGYSDLYDIELDHLSKGENIFDFWKQSNLAPSMNYVNFKYKESGTLRARNTFVEPNLSEDRSYRKLRLALASAHFIDTAFTYPSEWMPPEVLWREGGVNVRVFDEVWRGTDQVPHWLGQPLGPPVHLAARTPDLLEGQGENWPELFVARFEGEGVAFSMEGVQEAPILAVSSVAPHPSPIALRRSLAFVLPGIEVTGRDLFVSLRLRAEPLEGYPASVPRRVNVYAVPEGEVASPDNREFTWAGGDSFSASLYFQDVGPGTVHLKFEVEGGQRVYFESMTARSARDGRYREYEGGVVFANPSPRSYTFNVRRLFAGATLRRLQGSANQDPATNDGGLVGDKLTLPARDGLFAVRVVG